MIKAKAKTQVLNIKLSPHHLANDFIIKRLNNVLTNIKLSPNHFANDFIIERLNNVLTNVIESAYI